MNEREFHKKQGYSVIQLLDIVFTFWSKIKYTCSQLKIFYQKKIEKN